MEQKECGALFSIIERMIETSEPQRAEYLRGYHRGMRVLACGDPNDMTDDHYMLLDYSVFGSGDPYIDSYTRGYRDGFEGTTPESPSFSYRSPRSHPIASIV